MTSLSPLRKASSSRQITVCSTVPSTSDRTPSSTRLWPRFRNQEGPSLSPWILRRRSHRSWTVKILHLPGNTQTTVLSCPLSNRRRRQAWDSHPSCRSVMMMMNSSALRTRSGASSWGVLVHLFPVSHRVR